MATDERTVELAFQAAKLGAEWLAKRQLEKAEEDELRAYLREKEATRTFKTPSELTGGVVPGATGDEE